MKEFEELEATALFCPNCKKTVPVRKKLLLVLPDGELYEYLCPFCGTSVGSKKIKIKPQVGIKKRPKKM
ncbi:hypothetical protein CH333_08125 [candidate division WOR-3 bacterium JGI_Cruoil_03_44_89]|uniref:Cytoplasmic protein n=1 Tax=candidate division WOR-3 bacterium JGI_Cruoil_03_44_89 TaxID=1973748 RepID=A0A235BRQ1_UNCW3|nr:MAG: hypothetical protein CH333_08125 [candidate division WOR-3 bacterium JGI_Cruoil_03_44_89]